MQENTTIVTRHDLEAKLIKRCWEDEAFCKEFTSDPDGTLARYPNVPVAGRPKIIVHQEEPGSWHLVLPEKPANAAELSASDLEKISGGSTPGCVALSVTAIISGASFISGVVSVTEGGWRHLLFVKDETGSQSVALYKSTTITGTVLDLR